MNGEIRPNRLIHNSSECEKISMLQRVNYTSKLTIPFEVLETEMF